MRSRRAKDAEELSPGEAHDATEVELLHDRLRRSADVFTRVLELLRRLKARETAPCS